jgi:hypothetical protein
MTGAHSRHSRSRTSRQQLLTIVMAQANHRFEDDTLSRTSQFDRWSANPGCNLGRATVCCDGGGKSERHQTSKLVGSEYRSRGVGYNTVALRPNVYPEGYPSVDKPRLGLDCIHATRMSQSQFVILNAQTDRPKAVACQTCSVLHRCKTSNDCWRQQLSLACDMTLAMQASNHAQKCNNEPEVINQH